MCTQEPNHALRTIKLDKCRLSAAATVLHQKRDAKRTQNSPWLQQHPKNPPVSLRPAAELLRLPSAKSGGETNPKHPTLQQHPNCAPSKTNRRTLSPTLAANRPKPVFTAG